MDINNKTALHLLHDICNRYPHHTAVLENGNQTTTYAELWDRAQHISQYIKAQSTSSAYVGITLSKSSAYIETLVACWMCAKAFVPIGKELPEARRAFIIKEADIDLCIDETAYHEAVMTAKEGNINYPEPQDAAYIIYSSGTTGTPKGIVVSHAGLPNLVKCQSEAFKVNAESRYLFFLSTNFDASISDMMVTLCSGATLVIESDTSIDLSAHLFEIIDSRQVTHTDIPPALLRLCDVRHCPATLKTIVIGGEAADVSMIRAWSQRVNLVNVYGPTEATVCTSLCQCTPDWNIPVIGKVLDNTTYKIYSEGKLNANDGELWIAGIGLAIGYLKNEELTAKKFPVVDDTRYYRTADHVRRTQDGNYAFLGRIDRQVKLHGQLIELEEIEAVLRKLDYIKLAAVVKRQLSQEKNSQIICAFVEPKDANADKTGLQKLILQHLQHSLPGWMIPAAVIITDDMPTTVTGKTDYTALQTVPLQSTPKEETEIIYANEQEKAIAQIMADLMKVEQVAPTDNFFLLGADSLDCVVLISQLYNNLGKEVTMEELRQNPTPRLLAAFSNTSNAMCKNSQELENEWQVKFENNLNENLKGDGIFITGTTGFLGSHLLEHLLRRTDKTVYCLVRGAAPAEGFQRICKTFERFHLSQVNLPRVQVVCGDITQENLGINADNYAKLSQNVGTVFHCAATVNMLQNYNELKAANVTGTKHILDFCLNGSRKHLYYASTLSVFVATDRNTGLALESDLLDVPTNIYGGYGQTKFVCEKMILGIPAQHLEHTIFRFGLLCGNTQTGISAPKDFLGMFFRGAKKLDTLPLATSDSMAVDITPINQAIDIMDDIITSQKTGIFHIASETPLFYKHLCQLMLQEGLIHDILPYEEWAQKAKAETMDADIQATLMSLCRLDKKQFDALRYMDLFQTTDIKFDMTQTHACTRHRCQQTDDIIKRYLNQI